MTSMEEDVVILGGGIAGLATAVALKRVGIRAMVLEKADKLQTTGAAISLFPNAWLALNALGVSHKLTSTYPPLQKGLVTNVASGATREINFVNATNRDERDSRLIHRKALLETLASELPTNTVRFSSKLTTIETQPYKGSSISILHLDDGTTIKAKIFVGCDGINSMVARHFGLSKPVDTGRWAARGLTVYPDGHGLSEMVYQFEDAGKRAGFAPLNKTEVYWFMTSNSPHGDNKKLSPEAVQKEILENAGKNFPSEYLNIVRDADLSTTTFAPIVFRYPWNIILKKLNQQNMTLVGDAMHPMTPDLTQGGCTALEDAVVLVRYIGKSFIGNGGVIVPKDTAKAIDGYVKERKWRVAGLISTSYLSGWVQQYGSNRLMNWVRDVGFDKFFVSKFLNFADYDCGLLPVY